jgi:hypothetical protein
MSDLEDLEVFETNLDRNDVIAAAKETKTLPHVMSPQGEKMSNSIAEYLLMMHFFGHIDRKNQKIIKQNFLTDM